MTGARDETVGEQLANGATAMVLPNGATALIRLKTWITLNINSFKSMGHVVTCTIDSTYLL